MTDIGLILATVQAAISPNAKERVLLLCLAQCLVSCYRHGKWMDSCLSILLPFHMSFENFF